MHVRHSPNVPISFVNLPQCRVLLLGTYPWVRQYLPEGADKHVKVGKYFTRVEQHFKSDAPYLANMVKRIR